jgi:hypothetical protein
MRSGGGGSEADLFCGDGTDDAIALAGADIGLHMNGGTDIAQSAADAVLVRPLSLWYPGAPRRFESGTPSYRF